MELFSTITLIFKEWVSLENKAAFQLIDSIQTHYQDALTTVKYMKC